MEHLKNLAAGMALMAPALFFVVLFRYMAHTDPRTLFAASALIVFLGGSYFIGKLMRGR